MPESSLVNLSKVYISEIQYIRVIHAPDLTETLTPSMEQVEMNASWRMTGGGADPARAVVKSPVD